MLRLYGAADPEHGIGKTAHPSCGGAVFWRLLFSEMWHGVAIVSDVSEEEQKSELSVGKSGIDAGIGEKTGAVGGPTGDSGTKALQM
jgi:hypothetical protein